MSNSLGNNLLYQGFLTSTVLEHKSRITPPCVGGNSLFQQQVISKSPLSTEFRGNRLRVQKNKKIPMGKKRAFSTYPHALLTTDTSSEVNAQPTYMTRCDFYLVTIQSAPQLDNVFSFIST